MNQFHTATFAILIAEYPKDDRGKDDTAKWSLLQATATNSVKTAKGIETLHENSWQIDLNTDMNFLIDILACAKKNEIALRILLLDGEPNWTRYSPTKK